MGGPLTLHRVGCYFVMSQKESLYVGCYALRSGQAHSPIERCLWGGSPDPPLGIAVPLPLCCPGSPRLAVGLSSLPDLTGGFRDLT